MLYTKTVIICLLRQGKIMAKDAILELHNKFEQYKKELNESFQKENFTESFRQNLHNLNDYYTRQFFKEESHSKKRTLVAEYALLLETIKQIKAGSLTTDAALKNINQITSDRKKEIVIHNIFKTCELLFWLTAAVTSYAFCLGFGIPIMFFNLPMGLAITIGTCILTLEAGVQALKCIGEFKLFTATNKQDKLERNIASFFLPPKATEPFLDEEDELDLDLHQNAPLATC